MGENGKFVMMDGKLVWVPDFSKQPINNDAAIDFILKEEGFLEKPKNIGDGKITIGSGLTDPKWIELYKERGNKWSDEDNRMAVAEEVQKRREWNEENVPNWERLSPSAQNALLSYRYNYNYTRDNSPKLFKALEDFNLFEAAKQMDAASGNSKFTKGLGDRREREQNLFLSDYNQEPSIFNTEPEVPVSTKVTTPYSTKLENTKRVPAGPYKDRYVVTESEKRRQQLRKAFKAKQDYDRIMETNNLQNTAAPQFASTSSLFDKGGLLEPKDAWDRLSIPEKADIIKVGVKHGIFDLQELRKKYNEFKEGGSKEEEEGVNTIVPFTQRTEVVITPDTEYNQYLNTLPDNQRFTPNDKYDSYFYWKLNGRPKNFEEAHAKGMFNFDHSDGGYHANSIAFDDNTGIGYFMKPKDHDTVGFELDWFNKGLVTEEGGKQRPVTPEEAIELNEFRRNYILTDDPNRPNFFMYQPNERANGGSVYGLDAIRSGYNKFAGGGAMASDASSETMNEIPSDYTPLVSNKYQPIADALKSTNAGFNVDDYAYRVQKLHPEITREQVQSLYNSTPYIGSDKVYRTQEGGFRAGDETGYGRRVTLYPNAYTKNTGTKVTTSNANDTMGSTFAHETNHLYTDVLLGGSNDTEKDLLFDAYRPGFVVQDPKFNGDFSEERAINAQIRNRISRENGNVIGADLDKAIDDTPDDVLMEMLFDPNNGYINQSGKKHMQDKNGNWNRTDAIRKALKEVAFNSYDNLRDSNIAALGGPLVDAVNYRSVLPFIYNKSNNK